MYQKGKKQIYNKSHCVYDFGSQEILYFHNVDNFISFELLFHIHIKAKTLGFSFDEVFKLKFS